MHGLPPALQNLDTKAHTRTHQFSVCLFFLQCKHFHCHWSQHYSKDYLRQLRKECSFNVAIFSPGWICLQEWIVETNSFSSVSHCGAATNTPKKSNMLGKPLICIRLCFVYSSGLGIYTVCAKSCPNSSLTWNCHCYIRKTSVREWE